MKTNTPFNENRVYTPKRKAPPPPDPAAPPDTSVAGRYAALYAHTPLPPRVSKPMRAP